MISERSGRTQVQTQTLWVGWRFSEGMMGGVCVGRVCRLRVVKVMEKVSV